MKLELVEPLRELFKDEVRRMINEVKGISRVVYDNSGKPPAAIECEWRSVAGHWQEGSPMRERATITSVLGLLMMLAIPVTPAVAIEGGDTVAEITQLLNWFLAPENNPRAATHLRFWADDLVYTRATGLVRTKADIMAGFAGDPPPSDDNRWSAEDVLVRPYGDAAALTFRLVGRAADGKTVQFRNSAMFLKRDGEWRAVTWQATPIAGPGAQ